MPHVSGDKQSFVKKSFGFKHAARIDPRTVAGEHRPGGRREVEGKPLGLPEREAGVS